MTLFDGPESCCDCGGEDAGSDSDAGEYDAGDEYDAGGGDADGGTPYDGGDGAPDGGDGSDGGDDGGPPCDFVDICDVCFGDGSTCEGCDGVMGSGLEVDACGVCGGDGTSCAGCDGIPWSGLTYDECGVCGGDGTDCPACDGAPDSGTAYDSCGVCGGDDSSCAGCDGVVGSGLEYDECGVCGGDGSECIGCDGVVGSGLEYDACGVCGGSGPPCAPPPPPAKEYVMSIYFVPADGADMWAPLLSNQAYASPRSLLFALAQSQIMGSGHKNQGLVWLPHSVGHAYVDFYSRNADGTNPVRAPGFPTGQSGAGDHWDVMNTGAGGTILGTYDGWMNTAQEASWDIALRAANHGKAVTVTGPAGNVVVGREAAAQLIGRADFILSEATWKAVQARASLHVTSGTHRRYGLLLEPAIKSLHPGERGGEGAGCTSFASMCVVYSGAIPRTTLNPSWTRTITFGEKTIGRGVYKWGSHIRGAWPAGFNIHDRHIALPAVTNMGSWTNPVGLDRDGNLHKISIATGVEGATAQRTITGYWYDPDHMYFWVKHVFEVARLGGGTAVSLGRTWKSMSNVSSNTPGGYPFIETDARDAKPRATWDTATDPYSTDWVSGP